MRTLARECVYKYLFSRLFNPDDEGLFTVLCKDLSENDKEFAEKLCSSVVKNEEDLLNTIELLAKGYSIDRIHSTDKISLLMGITELNEFKDTPIPVVINEAVNLSSKYSGDGSTDFVNGILAEYVKRSVK